MRHPFITFVASVMAFGAVLSSCSGGSFTISGELDPSLLGDAQTLVELYDQTLDGDGILLDSKVLSEPSFTFKGKINPMKIYALVLTPGNISNDAGHAISFVPESKSIMVSFTSEGDFVQAGEITESLSQMQDALMEIYDERLAELDNADLNGLAAKADSIQREIEYARTAVYTLSLDSNPDNAVGKLALLGLLVDSQELPLEVAEEYYSRASKDIQNDAVISAEMNALRAMDPGYQQAE